MLEKTLMYVDPDGGDIRIRLNSPAMDRGTSENAPADDFLGADRPVGSGFDMGAYEVQY
jgi:hypothetical protein